MPVRRSSWEVTNTFIWQDTLALTRRNHNMRFGLEFKRHEIAEEQPYSVDGALIIATFQDFLLGQSAAQLRQGADKRHSLRSE